MDEAAHDAKFLELTVDVLGEARARALLQTLHALPSDLAPQALTALAAAEAR
jgi:hypothetical protein